MLWRADRGNLYFVQSVLSSTVESISRDRRKGGGERLTKEVIMTHSISYFTLRFFPEALQRSSQLLSEVFITLF